MTPCPLHVDRGSVDCSQRAATGLRALHFSRAHNIMQLYYFMP